MIFPRRSAAIFALFILHLSIVLGKREISPELQELAVMLHSQCQEETGVPENMIDGARTGAFVQDERLKCYMKCLLVQMSALDEDDGEMDIEGTIAIIPEEYQAEAEPIIRKCGTQKGANLCDTAFLTNHCWYNNAPNDYFLP